MGDDLPELSRPKPGLTRRRRETPSRCDGRPVPLRGRATPGRSGRHRRFACAVAAGPRDRGLDVPQGTGRRRNDGWAPSRGRHTGAAGDREGRDRIARKGGGSARIDGREARTRLRLGTVATARRPGCLERRGGGARSAFIPCRWNARDRPDQGPIPGAKQVHRRRVRVQGCQEAIDPGGGTRQGRCDSHDRRCIPVRPASIEASGSLLSRPDNGLRSQDRP